MAAALRQPGSPLTRRAFLLGVGGMVVALAVGRRLGAWGDRAPAHGLRPKRVDNLLEEPRDDGLALRPTPIDPQGPTFCLNAPGAFLWRRIDGTRSVSLLAAQLGAAYGLAPRAAKADTLAFLRSMERIGLIFDPYGSRATAGAHS